MNSFTHKRDPVVDVNNAESSLPSVTEMLAVISETPELAQNLQDLMQSSPSTSQDSNNPTISQLNSTESEAKEVLAEFDSTSPSDSRTTATAAEAATTTHLTCNDKNYQPVNISLQSEAAESSNCSHCLNGNQVIINAMDASAVKLVLRNNRTAVVGDKSQLNVCKRCLRRQQVSLPAQSNSAESGVFTDGKSPKSSKPKRRKRKISSKVQTTSKCDVDGNSADGENSDSDNADKFRDFLHCD